MIKLHSLHFGVAIILAILSISTGMPSSGKQEPRIQVFNENYTVEWQADFDEKSIEFNVTVNTLGFVGFGISLSGGMEGADIFIAGVFSNGSSYSNDYHGIGNTRPELDLESNWILLNSREEAGITYLQFKRLLDTCDLEDMKIGDGTLKMIWSIGGTDEIMYHGSSNRGVRSVNFLDAPRPPVDFEKYQKFEIRRNFSTPTTSDTNYWCTMNKRSATKKSHIVAFLPILETPEALAHTHHYQLTICRPPEGGPSAEEIYEPWISFEGEECYQEFQQIPTEYCVPTMYAWTKGGEMLVFPDDIGVPWGDYENEYFLFNVHINNPDLVDVTFETGIIMYYTEELRPIEAGIFEVYHNTYPSLLVPPETKDWTIVGHCSSECTEAGIRPEGINILTADLHAHVSATSIKVRHFRNGTELPWLIKDDTYDFNYQEYRTLPSPVKVLPGDSISIECTYDSSWKNPPSAVIGGEQTTDEMCIMFSYYYPKQVIRHCGAQFPISPIMDRYGVTNYTMSLDPLITAPEEVANVRFSELLSSYIEWTDAEKAELQEIIRYGPHKEFCNAFDESVDKEHEHAVLENSADEDGMVSYPPFDVEYSEPSTCNK